MKTRDWIGIAIGAGIGISICVLFKWLYPKFEKALATKEQDNLMRDISEYLEANK